MEQDQATVAENIDAVVANKHTTSNAQIHKYLDRKKIHYQYIEFKNVAIYKLDNSKLTASQKKDITTAGRVVEIPDQESPGIPF
jgi:hypothetical protein